VNQQHGGKTAVWSLTVRQKKISGQLRSVFKTGDGFHNLPHFMTADSRWKEPVKNLKDKKEVTPGSIF
jgi:hypothetical protein